MTTRVKVVVDKTIVKQVTIGVPFSSARSTTGTIRNLGDVEQNRAPKNHDLLRYDSANALWRYEDLTRIFGEDITINNNSILG